MRALVVDDHPLTRRGAEALLRNTFADCEVWGTSRTAEAVTLTARLDLDLVLLDLRLPEPPSSAEACRAIRRTPDDVPIVVLTAFEDVAMIGECLGAGANGCLLKDSSTAYLASALRRVLTHGAHEIVLDPRIEHALSRRLVDTLRDDAPPVSLTRRESEILVLVAEGLSNRAIGERLVVAESTAKWHVRRLMTKLAAESRWQAVVRARERGLL